MSVLRIITSVILIAAIAAFGARLLATTVSGVTEVDRRVSILATLAPLVAMFVAILAPCRGPLECFRLIAVSLVSVCYLLAATSTYFLAEASILGWGVGPLWLIWTLNDRTDAEKQAPLFDYAVVRERWLLWPLGIPLGLTTIAILIAQGHSTTHPVFDPFTITQHQQFALIFPTAAIFTGLLSANRGKNYGFLVGMAMALAALYSVFSFLLWWTAPLIIHLGPEPVPEISTGYLTIGLITLIAWTILPLAFMLWANDWIDSRRSQSVE